MPALPKAEAMIATLTGSNSFLRRQALQARLTAFKKDYGDLAVERLDGQEASYEQMLGSVESQPFLAARKLVVLDEPSVNKAFMEQFEAWTQRVGETTDVIIVEPKLDKRLSYYK